MSLTVAPGSIASIDDAIGSAPNACESRGASSPPQPTGWATHPSMRLDVAMRHGGMYDVPHEAAFKNQAKKQISICQVHSDNLPQVALDLPQAQHTQYSTRIPGQRAFRIEQASRGW
ncbi:hypothetical protein [Burkholderia ambifaria]|uniref:hypothetical protein n=1 Tax=Burkholderia ambifaria TaxID=152480 RepID=UPI0012FE568B|nr:hypothetical protein [Burkholderia ambifaria]